MVRAETTGRIGRVTLDRPDKKNAITAEMYVQLAEALAKADADPAVRVILLTGGRDCFTAGNDLADFLQRPPSGAGSPTWRFLETMPALAKPVVAAVAGPAVGVGTTMLLHCDLVYAAHTARFQLPFVALGIVPEFGSTYLLPLLAGYQRAAELLLLAQPFDARKALDIGLVSEIVSPDQLLDTAEKAASRLAELPPESLRLTKRLMKSAHAERVRRTIEEEGGLFRERLNSPEAKEALRAFLEKRKPDFSRF
ncbi:MAG TPA: enoyl-CoA hydratase [Burkholderiales bacterium]|nr:enoyl-CoA hydratase [Burkholderiales bacterium]